MEASDLAGTAHGESSAEVRARVEAARETQRARFEDPGIFANGQMAAREVGRHCQDDRTAISLLRAALARFGLSARSYHRVLKVARTIADLAGEERVREAHVAEALQYRSLERAAGATSVQ